MTIQAPTPQATPPQGTPPRGGVSSRRGWVLGVGAAIAAGALVTLWNPSDDGISLCPFHAATGLDCPACGSLRAVAALGRGRPMDAADQNLLLVMLPLLVLIGLVLRRIGVSVKVLVVIAVTVVIAFWVVRNLPGVGFLPTGVG